MDVELFCNTQLSLNEFINIAHPTLRRKCNFFISSCIVVAMQIPSMVHAKEVELTAAQREAKTKCPLGPYDRCGELVGAFPKFKGKSPAMRKIGGFQYEIPAEFFENLDPSGYSNQLTAFWIPLAHKLDGTEVAGTQFARDSVKYGLMWPYGVRIKIETNRYPISRPNTYYRCKAEYIPKDSSPYGVGFDMTMYANRDNSTVLDACFVSDDPAYEFYPGVPVSYIVRYNNARGHSTSSPFEERATAGFTMRDDKVYVEYTFETATFAWWKEIHRAVIGLVKSWEK
jgi:hypothetical protein